jgi:hypothetical protein
MADRHERMVKLPPFRSPMNQLSLNVLAVTIFAMTLSVLLAPLLRIPEAVPAVVIISLLSLATGDALVWQGKGATIGLDWLARFSPQYRDRVLRHEAGHFLVAHQLGFPVTDYSLSAWEAFRKGHGGQGGVQFATTALETAAQSGQLSTQILDRLCIAWMAGIAAEQMIYGNVEGGEADRYALQQALMQLKLPPSRIELKQRWAILQAQNLLAAESIAYENLCQALAQRQPVGECERLIELSRRPQTAPVEARSSIWSST